MLAAGTLHLGFHSLSLLIERNGAQLSPRISSGQAPSGRIFDFGF
jgi:hypothetical protein